MHNRLLFDKSKECPMVSLRHANLGGLGGGGCCGVSCWVLQETSVRSKLCDNIVVTIFATGIGPSVQIIGQDSDSNVAFTKTAFPISPPQAFLASIFLVFERIKQTEQQTK